MGSAAGVTRQITEIEFVHTVGLGVIIFCFQVTIPQYQLHIINHHSKQNPNTDYVKASLICLATLFVSDLCVII